VRLPLLLIVVLAGPLAARQRPTPPPPVSLTETAARLAESGAAHHNPRALMAAAEILRMAERGSPRVARDGPATGPTGDWEGPMTSASLLRLASRLAADQADWATADYAAWLLQLPDSVPVTRGATGGPVWADAYLAPGGEIAYTIDFSGGQTENLLQVSAGNPGAVLECTLHQAGMPDRVASQVKSLAGACSLKWRQTTAGRMTLRVRNRGPAAYFVVSSN
jgi:hypothetical protein